MGFTGRAARAERARVAARVQALLAQSLSHGTGDHALDTVRSVGASPDVEDDRTATTESGWVPGESGWPRQAERADESRPNARAKKGRGELSDRSEGGGGLRALVERCRIDPGRRAARALTVLALAIVGVFAWWLTAAHAREVPVSASSGAAASAVPPASASGLFAGTENVLDVPSSAVATGEGLGSAVAVSSPAAASPTAGVVVDVAGRVRRPGVYSLPAGSRVDDALRAAGGARGRVNLLSLNLAALLADGEQVVVGRTASTVRGGTGAVAGSSEVGGAVDGSSASAAEPVDLNTATLEELETLPGVGPATAQKILDWRAAHGSFSTVDQLDDVSGIGPVRLAALRPLVTV